MTRRNQWLLAASIPAALLAIACGGGTVSNAAADDIADLRSTSLLNTIAYISPQCFTKTQDDTGGVHNPCYACHIPSAEPNYLDDGDVQLSYAFPGIDGEKLANPWTNLFKDRTAAVARIDEATIKQWVRQDNYLAQGRPALATTLTSALPRQWDADGNGRWDGYVPDAYFRFDTEGYDLDPSGQRTGWRAFAYAPFLGTFWPTNGSTDDVLIRLPAAMREDEGGVANATVYNTNLAIVTALIQRRDVALTTPVDERTLLVDLDKDGQLGTANRVRFDWAPLQGKTMSYVGRARTEQAAGRLHLAAGLYPEGTEFLHSVRYINVGDDNSIQMAPRMKELRYASKRSWYSYSDLREMALKEIREKAIWPERTRQFAGSAERGLSNGQGWTYQGFIEDRKGALRPQTYEETAFCIGCHSGIGATTDSSFAFARKLPDTSFRQAWYHWSQKGLTGTPEPQRRDGEFEYAYYLRHNGAGDEYRDNAEVRAKFFDAQGVLKPDALAALRQDVTTLLFPSPARAWALNKAYRVIVDEQSFREGRDATISPARNVHSSLVLGSDTGVSEPLTGP